MSCSGHLFFGAQGSAGGLGKVPREGPEGSAGRFRGSSGRFRGRAREGSAGGPGRFRGGLGKVPREVSAEAREGSAGGLGKAPREGKVSWRGPAGGLSGRFCGRARVRGNALGRVPREGSGRFAEAFFFWA